MVRTLLVECGAIKAPENLLCHVEFTNDMFSLV